MKLRDYLAMKPLTLSPAELHELTGAKSFTKQRAELRAMGFPFRVLSSGRPVVLRSWLESPNAKPVEPARPDLSVVS